MAIRFLVDFMLGKLARELRMMGFDTVYINKEDITQQSIFSLLNRAKQEGRKLLTRNHKLMGYAEVFFIKSEKVSAQVKEVLEGFKLYSALQPFSRCLRCNELLRVVTKTEVKGKVPFYIYQTKEEFAHCSKCDKFYWRGSHLKNMQERLKEILENS